MTLVASSRSVPGTLRQEVLIDGVHRLVTDEPVAVGGEGSAPAPHELLAAAIASCVSTTLVMYARRKEWDLRAVTVDAEFDPKATPRTYEVVIHVEGDLDAGQLDRLEQVAAACPVRRSLEADAVFHERLVAPVL